MRSDMVQQRAQGILGSNSVGFPFAENGVQFNAGKFFH